MSNSRNPFLPLPAMSAIPARLAQTRRAFRQLVLGSANVPQQCVLGLRDPQSEVSVWLEGAGVPMDVTHNNVMVSANPLTIAIGLENTNRHVASGKSGLTLRFREMRGERRLLGEIRLCMAEATALGDEQLCLFRTRGCRNYCVPQVRLWIRYLDHAYRKWKAERGHAISTSQVRTSELRSVFAFYICPRPVVLVSVVHEEVGSIFPMDLIGPVGTRHFAVALHNTSAPLRLMAQSQRIALSSVPIEQSSRAFELGKNHKQPAVDFGSLPFPIMSSEALGLPVPRFSLRTRELRIEMIRRLETHTLFVGRIVRDQLHADGPQMFQVHGFYQAWRQRQT
jgi:flavin reductase (DIM6/NTAB) family NADH-FMN oxidoreductase RutF